MHIYLMLRLMIESISQLNVLVVSLISFLVYDGPYHEAKPLNVIFGRFYAKFDSN